MKVVAVIPARYASTRLPAKPLVKIKGVPLVVRVFKMIRMCNIVDEVIVATDDERIASVVKEYGGDAVMTPLDIKSGGDRVAYVAKDIQADIILNVQVDAPIIYPDMIESLIEAMKDDKDTVLSLLATRIVDKSEVKDPNIVKVVFDKNLYAIYFSRSPIPYPRTKEPDYYKHIGPYAYKKDFLLKFMELEQTPLEVIESLEMLRVIEHGYKIKMVLTDKDIIEVDVPEDVIRVERYIEENGDPLEELL